jgi:hypothetical protein
MAAARDIHEARRPCGECIRHIITLREGDSLPFLPALGHDVQGIATRSQPGEKSGITAVGGREGKSFRPVAGFDQRRPPFPVVVFRQDHGVTMEPCHGIDQKAGHPVSRQRGTHAAQEQRLFVGAAATGDLKTRDECALSRTAERPNRDIHQPARRARRLGRHVQDERPRRGPGGCFRIGQMKRHGKRAGLLRGAGYRGDLRIETQARRQAAGEQ